MTRHERKPPTHRSSLDPVDRGLVLALSQDGRRSAAALAQDLGLSRQAVAERLRSLERRGIVRGYQADVDSGALGLAVRALIHLTLDGGATPQQEKGVLERLTDNPHVRSVYRVSGEDCFVAEVVCRRIEDVAAILAKLKKTRVIQSSRTSFVLEAVLRRGALGPIDGALLSE